MDFIIL